MIAYQIIQEITVGTESNLIFAQQLCDKLNEQQDGSTYSIVEVDNLYMSPETMVSSTKEDNDLLQWQDSKNKSEIYVLVDTDNTLDQLDHCYAKSLNSAQIEFSMRGWVIGDVMPYWEYQGVLQNENDLNSLENQSNEC